MENFRLYNLGVCNPIDLKFGSYVQLVFIYLCVEAHGWDIKTLPYNDKLLFFLGTAIDTQYLKYAWVTFDIQLPSSQIWYL